MIAAIYARKSTDQNIADEEKSVTRQVERARAYAERKGWTVDPACIFVDDGISGADFVRREGFLRLMNTLKPRPPFQALVMMDQSRLGRSLDEVPYAIRRITEAGARIFFYLGDQEVKRDTAVDRFQSSVMAFVDEMHREQSRQRTRDAMRRKAERGHVAGGIVYGYRNVRIGDHVEREPDATQAATVRRIFAWIADGLGFNRITKALNAEGVPSPTGRGWGVFGVREITLRELYRGVLLYGRTRWEDRGGRKVKVATPSSEWIRLEAPALRIVPEPLWIAAQARLARTRVLYVRQTDGKLLGRPEGHAPGRFLPSGLLTCAHCGHSAIASTQQTHKYGRHRVYRDYVCAGHRERGPTVCAVPLRAPLEALW